MVGKLLITGIILTAGLAALQSYSNNLAMLAVMVLLLGIAVRNRQVVNFFRGGGGD